MTKDNEDAKKSQQIKVTISLEALPNALDSIISDPEIRERFKQRPVETLAKLGIEFDPDTSKRLKGKTIAEVLAEDEDLRGIPAERLQASVLPFIKVVTKGTKPVTRGTKPVTNSRVKSGVKIGAETATTTSGGTLSRTATSALIKSSL